MEIGKRDADNENGAKKMLGVVFYILACVAGSGALTFLWTVTRPIQTRDEMRSWRTWIGMFVFSLFAPYGYFEILTRIYGPDMKKAVDRAMADTEVVGDIQYYKVVWYTGSTAKVIVVCEEKADWGGTDRPTVKVALKKDSQDKWIPESYDVIQHDRTNKDGIIFPPLF